MQLNTLVFALMGLSAIAEASAIHRHQEGHLVSRQGNGRGGGGQGRGGQGQGGQGQGGQGQGGQGQGGNNNNNNNNGGGNCLAANAVQNGSKSNGQEAGAEAGQAPSKTDNNNFINFCAGKTLTNGVQNKAGSCNGIPMGEIPAQANMASTVITNPLPGKEPQPNQDFDVTVQIANMDLGTFTNPDNTYYAAPQQLGNGGKVIGHTHVTIQDLGNTLTPTQPLDASKFVFFKGINDAGNGQGLLKATVTGGLPAGNYRICTMAGASNHQPILMPVAQRGAQDDCLRIKIGGGGGGGGGNNNNNNNNNNGGQGQGGQQRGQGQQGGGGGGRGQGQGNSQNSQGASNSNTNSKASQQNGATSSSATTPSKASGSSSSASQANQGSAGQNGNSQQAAAEGNNSNASANGSNGNAASSAGGAIGGISAPAVTDSGNPDRPFEVNGNTFVNKGAALQRACAIQNNACADAVNSGKVSGKTVADCGAQEQTCNSQGAA